MPGARRYASAEAELWRYPLAGPTGGSGITAVDVIVVSLEDSGGETGLGFSYVLGGGGAVVKAAAGDLLARLVAGEDCAPPETLWRRLAGSLNRVGRGIGYVAIAKKAPVPIATGEHLQGAVEVKPYLAADACAVLQPDLAMMGGISECLRAGRIAEYHDVSVSPHFLPALFVHLACALPNVRWLEDFPLLEPLFDSPAEMDENGTMTPGDVPGHGLAWASGARDAYCMRD